MNLPFPEPTHVRDSRAEVLLEYLDYFRHRTVAKIEQLPAAEHRSSRLPSGWTPLELVKHLVGVERRWLEWRFAGSDIGYPFGDRHDGCWFVTDEQEPATLEGSCYTSGRSIFAISATWTLSTNSWEELRESSGFGSPPCCGELFERRHEAIDF